MENYSLDLKIPGSTLLINNLKNLVKNCKIEYLNKEDEIRKGTKKKDDKKAKKKTLEDVHFNKKQYLKSRLWNEELLTDEIFSEYSEDILKDFFNIYFYDKNSKTAINQKQEDFLLFLYSKKMHDNLLDRFLYFFLWIGSYHETILKLLEIFNKLDKYFDTKENLSGSKLEHDKQSLLDCLIQVYDSFNFPKEEEEKEKVNGIFFRICESICHVITDVKNIDFEKINLKELCTDLNEIAQIFTQFNSTLFLGIKGHFSLISIAKLIEYSEKKKLNEKDFKIKLNIFIKNIYFEKCHFLKNNFPQSIKSFNEQLNVVINLSDELSMKIIVNKLLQYFKFEQYKIELVKIIFQYPQLIKYSSLFFNYIFLTQPIKPKRQTKIALSEDDKSKYIKNFGEIKNQNKNSILTEINDKAKNNEILIEILIYIFELRILSYFEDCQNTKFIKENPVLLLTELNFGYYLKTYNDIKNKDFGKLETLGKIFYYSFLRCYLYYFVKMQINNNELKGLEPIHKNLMDISESELGKMITLYIAKIFILNNKKEYFLKDYLKNEKRNPWKDTITSKNDKSEFFPVSQYENSKNLLFLIYSKINSNALNNEFINHLEIRDIYYIINFAHNEIIKNIKDDNIQQSTILLKINEKIDNLKFDINTNNKIKKLFYKISNIESLKEILNEFPKEESNEFPKEISLKSNLQLIFNMIRIYIIGFEGIKKNSFSSLIYSDKVSYAIKVFFNQNSNDKIIFIKSYYKIKKYLEDEYIGKKNYLPAYICSCGRCYFIKDSLPVEIKDCECGLKIGGKNEKLIERNNHVAIYYDEKQKSYIESGRGNKIVNKCQLKGRLLKDYQKELIIEPILNKSPKLKDLLLNNYEINDDKSFAIKFVHFIFLSQIFIEYKIMNEEEIKEEFDDENLLEKINRLSIDIEKYLESKKINYIDFMNYFCDIYCTLLKSNDDFFEKKDKLYDFIINLLKKEFSQEFNNIEINILTALVCNPDFKNEDLKYLLTATKYPNKKQLEDSISSYTKKPLPILKAFIKINEKKNSDISKLSHIEIINDFINSFAEENNNIISRKNSEKDTIETYLEEARKKSEENEKSLLEIQFDKFCDSYEQIAIDMPLRITNKQMVINILNDDKIPKKETPINKLYSHLIEIQNEYLQKIIDDYNSNKNELNEDIIIKNAIEQIQKEIPIQLATKADIISFNVSNNIILSFEELFSFYSLKNIFNEEDDKIDYSKYSEIKFKLNMIEKELINIILTGKRLFSKNQITYKFYLDPLELEEKTKKFAKFTKIYGKEELTDIEKNELLNSIEQLKKIILPNLDILISYLIKENKYIGKQNIKEIKFHSNLFLNQSFIQLFNDSKNFTINKLISIYEFIEENIWDFIQDRYINEEFKKRGFSKKYKDELDKFYSDENRKLKNEKLASLLVKYICRYLPYESKEIESNDLFEIIKEKNMDLSEEELKELDDLKNNFGAKVCDIIDLTTYLEQKNYIQKRKENNNLEKENQNQDKVEEKIHNNPPKKEEEEEGEEEEEENENDKRTGL